MQVTASQVRGSDRWSPGHEKVVSDMHLSYSWIHASTDVDDDADDDYDDHSDGGGHDADGNDNDDDDDDDDYYYDTTFKITKRRRSFLDKMKVKPPLTSVCPSRTTSPINITYDNRNNKTTVKPTTANDRTPQNVTFSPPPIVENISRVLKIENKMIKKWKIFDNETWILKFESLLKEVSLVELSAWSMKKLMVVRSNEWLSVKWTTRGSKWLWANN